MKSLISSDLNGILLPLEAIWQVHTSRQSSNGSEVAKWDEEFHCALVAASKNSEFARVHLEVTERIRIVRRLDFTKPSRITTTYREHASMLEALRRRAFGQAADQLATHIEVSRVEARELTLLKLQNARKDFPSHESFAGHSHASR
jgi:DNA-binding GntR family transcriptional regulator